ncbi:putative SNF2 DNA repair protein [Trypanosoma theileri]|uniref:Putative SNF2 DNA repair protein n=1 Tax=Trypanosoma theileri TaxID=67003 RepID=A0A1X0NWY2_9TRYP|nr:putative SNF2 DNA repair protein [Trypanosoma theileri]ORC88620.1 putative SNF2 DNA repair protein [Trypanosoma theileri]
MEQFLASGQKYCLVCNTLRWFKISRFGCVFACRCPGCFIDFRNVLRDYVNAVNLGERQVEFVPVISGRVSTEHMKIAQVELDLLEKAVCLRFMNTTSEDALQIVSGLPNSLGQWVATVDGYFRFPMESLDLLLHELKMASDVNGDPLYINEPSQRSLEIASTSNTQRNFSLSELLPARLFSALHQHQIDGICRALMFDGRVLFADEMGVGKTLQAIGTVAALKAFPTLVVCPAALRHLWVEEFEKWLTDVIELDDIHIISSSSNFLSIKDTPKVVITSFHMAAILATQMKSRVWKCIVVDESHTLHTTLEAYTDAQYTSLLCDIGKRSRYCLFLSGTPSLTSPFDLFNQIDTISPGLLGRNRCEFALRYCRTEFSPYFRVWESTRGVELYSLLASTCMIRRLKSEILTDLPSKQRVLLRVPEKVLNIQEKGNSFQEKYATSWRKKSDKIIEVVDYVLTKYTKVVIFAHHIKLLDCLTKHINEKKYTWIRIDGSTPVSSRATSLSLFNNGDIRVAIIGITACAVGIHLTGASCALFAELPPDVTWMQQAEDRLHRPGQEKRVIFFYIIGSGSFFDGELFARLCRSFQAVRQATDGVSSSLTASYASHAVSLSDEVMDVNTITGRYAGTSLHLTTSASLLFRISPNTGRIHVSQAKKYLTSLSIDEAQQHWSLSDDFSRQLTQFMLNIEKLSSYEYRRLKFSARWFPSDFTWKPEKNERKTAFRYSHEKPLLGRVFFWKVNRRHNYSTHSYGALLSSSGGSYKPLCLECEHPLSCTLTISPGDIVHTDHDTDMFCGGSCREAFYIKRSGFAVRRSVREADKGICSCCQVDCETLCALVAVATTRKDRESIIDQMHPHMRHYPNLFNRIVEHPVPGNVWNADHILPVSQGGGEASMDNLQTLCVACHLEKTISESKMKHKYITKESHRTTVDVSSGHFAFKATRRVTAARVQCTQDLLSFSSKDTYFFFFFCHFFFSCCPFCVMKVPFFLYY